MNPKAITMGELYGEVNKITLEWHDGLMPFIVRQAVVDTSEDHHWIVCDGPVDALWHVLWNFPLSTILLFFVQDL